MKKSKLKYFSLFAFIFICIFMSGIHNVNADTNYDVYVNGERLTDVKNKVSAGSGTITYNHNSKELVLENISLNASSNYGINLTSTTDTIKVILKGTNTITATGDNFGISSSNEVIFTGSGKLNIVSDWPSISGKKVIIDGANLDLTSTRERVTALESDKGLIIKNGSKVKAKGSGSAISSYAKMEISDSKLDLEATRDTSNAIYVEPTNGDGSLTISNSSVKAKSGYASIYSFGKMMLTSSQFNLESIAGGIYSDTTVEIKNSKVYVGSGNYGIGTSREGTIIVDDSALEIKVNNVSFTKEPTLVGMNNKAILGGQERNGSDARTIVDEGNGFNLSSYNYIKTLSKYTIKIIKDNNSLVDINDEFTLLEGENKKISINAKDGYKLKSVLVNDQNALPLINNNLMINNISSDIIIEITTEKTPIPTKDKSKEKKKEAKTETIKNPQTYDRIGLYILTSIASFISLVSMSIFVKKNNIN